MLNIPIRIPFYSSKPHQLYEDLNKGSYQYFGFHGLPITNDVIVNSITSS